MRPIELGPNPIERFYRGGPAIAGFRGLAPSAERAPEDWVGSATAAFGTRDVGLTRLADGRLLREAFQADPEGFFGPGHAEPLGGDPGLLVKLLDAGERLPVHCHPDRAFARRHLDCPYGKTEAWVVAATAGPGSLVHLGFRQDQPRETLDAWVARQDRDVLLGSLHALPAAPGDTFLVPAGVPHAIGEGVLIVELQEPTDLSVLLEWEGFDVDGPADGHLGLGFDVALGCVDRSGWDRRGLDRLRSGRPGDRPGVERLFPAEADPFFRAERIRPGPGARLPAAFCILVVLEGGGVLATARDDRIRLARGATVLVPHAAGETRLEGDLTAIRCLPPEPDPVPV